MTESVLTASFMKLILLTYVCMYTYIFLLTTFYYPFEKLLTAEMNAACCKHTITSLHMRRKQRKQAAT